MRRGWATQQKGSMVQSSFYLHEVKIKQDSAVAVFSLSVQYQQATLVSVFVNVHYVLNCKKKKFMKLS